MKKWVYTFYEGDIIELDTIYFIQALGDKEWWIPHSEGGDIVKITRTVKFTITETMPRGSGRG